jgi:cytochrome c oxidase subunit 2
MIAKFATVIGRRPLAAAAVVLAAWATPASAFRELNMPVGVSELSIKIYHLHMLIFWVCVAIAAVVFGVMIYSIAAFRKSRGAIADTHLTHSTKVEIVWTVIPVIILVFMAVPAARTIIDIEDTRGTQLSIKVTGYQWKWHYDYLDQNVNFFSTLARASNAARQLGSGIDPNTVPNYLLDVDNPLVIPAGMKVRLLVTANDVIHAWWVPAFGMKKDAIPGFINELWIKVTEDKIGTYRGQCAELCGRDHGFMPIVVEVKSKKDFAAWLKTKQEEGKQTAAPTAGATAQAPASAAPAGARVDSRTESRIPSIDETSAPTNRIGSGV